MHLFNVFLFNRFRRRALEQMAGVLPPLPPTSMGAHEVAR
jgi:hypothetical protein